MPSEREIEAAAKAIFDIKYADFGRPRPDVEPPWSVCRSRAKAALEAAEIARADEYDRDMNRAMEELQRESDEADALERKWL
jgi:hypothetical protein